MVRDSIISNRARPGNVPLPCPRPLRTSYADPGDSIDFFPCPPEPDADDLAALRAVPGAVESVGLDGELVYIPNLGLAEGGAE